MTATFVKSNGAEIPAVGFGTWELRGQVAFDAVKTALNVGYRHIDTAAMYGNEAEVGKAIRQHTAARADIFVTTKVWPSEAGDGPFQRSAEASLKRLDLDMIDLLLIHWPSPSVSVKEQIHTLCDTKRRGLTRHIGISNFSAEMVEQAVGFTDEPLVTNQIEHHPWIDQSATIKACVRHGISITSHSPLGRARRLTDTPIVEIARAKGATPAQVVLRWHMQQPMNITIPRSSNPGRIRENFGIFDFELSPEEMRRVSSLAR